MGTSVSRLNPAGSVTFAGEPIGISLHPTPPGKGHSRPTIRKEGSWRGMRGKDSLEYYREKDKPKGKNVAGRTSRELCGL